MRTRWLGRWLAVTCVAVVLPCALADPSRAQEPVPSVETSLAPSTTTTMPVPDWPPAACGYDVVGLTFTRRDFSCVEAPRVATSIDAAVTGPIARVRFTQRYLNPSQLWVDGRFRFEVPQEATVDTMRIIVGDRAFVSRIYTQKDGDRVFRAAAKAGIAAAQLEGSGRWFYGSVANIGPRENVVIEVEYTQLVRSFTGTYELVIPTALSADDGNQDELVRATPGTTIPTRRPDGQTRNIVSARIRVNAGLAVEGVSVAGAGHRITRSATGFAVDVPRQDASIHEDLSVTWTAARAAGIQVEAALERTSDRGDFAAVLITPPVGAPSTGGRNVVFVVPPLGWYEYEEIQTLFGAVVRGIYALGPTDRFNVVTGASRQAFPGLVPVTQESKNAALEFADQRLSALFERDVDGDIVFDWDAWEREWEETALDKMVRLALRTEGTEAQPLDVVMINDGSETWTAGDLLTTLAAHRTAHQRVHMVVANTDPNFALIDAITRAGGGSYVLATDVDLVESRLKGFIGSLGAPVVRNLRIGPKGGPYIHNREVLPGHQITQLVRLPAGVDTVEIDGMIGDRPWHWEQKVTPSAAAGGIASVWATQAICDLDVQADIEWSTSLRQKWEVFEAEFEKTFGRTYWDEYYEQWKRAYDAAPKNASGGLLDYEAFRDSFVFVSPLPEPKGSRDWEKEQERLALDHHVVVSGLTTLVAIDPAGPRTENAKIPLADVVGTLPPEWGVGGVVGPDTEAFAATFDDPTVVSAFTRSLRGTVIPRGAADALEAAEPAVETPSFTGSAGLTGLGVVAVALAALGLALVALSGSRHRSWSKAVLARLARRLHSGRGL